ncbi:hypothetical protein R3P38DRAFT_2760782 [Favolaschia claudopus]|uniref:Uncharacterized protein n=1 Tax=Favolaschia claudopus TaxID=2862362 RepID=A0AAW0DV16_9AGAR
MRDSLDVFAQEAGSKIQSLEEERRKEYEIDQLRTEVQRLTETIHALDAARRDSLNEIFTWCRDENGVLWDAIKAVKKGLGERESDSTHKQSGGSQHGVGQCKIEMDLLREEIFSGFDVLRDEVRTIQVRLRNARVCGVLPQQITMEEFSEAIQFGQNEIVKVENELTRVFDKVGFIGESLRNLQEGFERQRINLDALHEEMMKESDWVHDEIRTIQTILHQARIRAFEPLLSKKQKKALERAKLARSNNQNSVKENNENRQREVDVKIVDEVAARRSSEEDSADDFEFLPNDDNLCQKLSSCREQERGYSDDNEAKEIASEFLKGDRPVEYENYENSPKSRNLDVLDARERLSLQTQL